MFEAALTNAGLTWVNFDGNYISSITYRNTTLAEKDNGPNSGWMYTLNGDHPKNGVAEQFLTDGDCILFHYTDDYTVEGGVGDSAIQSMTMEPETLTIEAGKTGALTVSFTPALLNGNVRVEWTSADTAIASVDKDGVVTGLAEGETTITATAGGKSVMATVTVTPGDTPVVAVESVTVSPASLTFKVGETGTLTVTVLPENATSKDVQWSSDNETVATVKGGVVTALKAGTAKITATAGGKSGSATVTVEAEEAEELTYEKALKSVLQYLQEKVTNPKVSSTYGEWAVFALNRGNAATDAWNSIYLENLKTYVDDCDGVLSPNEYTYTNYSRVILALTSMGVDASQFSTDKATYDLVKPLLDKNEDGDYMAEIQGNNGTAFALLALDSHDYLSGAEGKKARADLIESLKKNQMADGCWSISGPTPSLDVTAAAIYALAPYYLDEAKLAALGGTVTYAEVKDMVDQALAYLSAAQSADGGYGSESPEADVWVLIALSSIGRDAATDEAFVKADGSILDHLLLYFDKTTGGFKKNLSGNIINQMSTEQAAYGLVAYDRFKNNKNTLYDMRDVEIASLEEKADQAAADEVEELIDAIGEVTLKSSAAISAARSAYNALTSAQKALVSNLDTLTDAEAAYKKLEEEAEQEEIDRNAAESVDALIDAIGTVTLDSEKAIKAARAAYDALTTTQKKLVEGLAVLEAAEKKLAELKENAETLATVTFRLKGGTSKEVKDGEEIVYTKGDVNNALPTAERDGYTFKGWFDAPVGGTQHTKVTAALPDILYVQWTSNSGSENTITVSFVLYGDTAHGSTGGPHTLAESNLTEWIALAFYEVDKNSTVLDVFEEVLTMAGMTWDNPSGNYVKSITNGDVTLAEFTNGQLSGWKYTLNGIYSSNGVSEQSLTDGDCILFHYTDDYTEEANMTGNAVQSMMMETKDLTVETGKTGELKVSFEPAQLNGSVRIDWTSDDTAIASVDKNGVVTGISEGKTTITAKSEATGFSVMATVTVVAGEEPVIAVESVTVTPEALTLKEGETGTLTATILPDDATAQDVQWSSDNEAIATVKDGVVTAVKEGTATITATAGGKSAAVTVTVEAEEPQDTDEITYSAALKSVLKYLEEKVPNPKLAEISGEWAVFALNRGNAAAKEWNDTYLANLTNSLDEVNGVLAEGIKYSAYSRVILALTSMGVDASQVTTDKATYDLVKPLLDKDEDGNYMVEAQGNNGTIFALLALDSHDYLPGSDGKALRAELIASLMENRLDSGAWAISGKTSPDLDMTAAAVYALAPYYLDEAKLSALGGTVTYAEVKTMVDGALAYLSKQQAADGGFGSAEADAWVVIALSSVGRDADTDAMFVKAEGSLLDDLLSYYDKSSGGFLREDNISHLCKFQNQGIVGVLTALSDCIVTD